MKAAQVNGEWWWWGIIINVRIWLWKSLWFIYYNATEEAALDEAIEGLLKSEEQQKQQEKILNITQLWVETGLVNFEAGEYSSTFLPADIVYQGNNTILLQAESFGGGTRFWHAVEIVQGQGFEIKDTMVLNDEMITYDGEEFTMYNTVRVLLVK